MTTEDNGNVCLIKPTSSSNEDLSEYTDADESISAPTEFLAEFLSAVMIKDYLTALKYCKLILQYEPNNATAKEFYPLIIEKLKISNKEEAGSNDSEEEETTSSPNSENENSSCEDSSESQEEEDESVEAERGESADKQSSRSSGTDATTGSYSSLEDDEVEINQLTTLAAKYKIDNINLGNGNNIYNTNMETSLQDNQLSNVKANNLLASSQQPFPFGTSSDSESPTEPVTQHTIAMLRAKVVLN